MIKKSRPGSALNSFKISVKAEDLQKALDPNIWPLRVKVREYIYYPRRAVQQGGNQQQQGQGQGRHVGQQYGGETEQLDSSRDYSGQNKDQRGFGGHELRHQEVVGAAGLETGVPTFNRFNGLDNVSL